MNVIRRTAALVAAALVLAFVPTNIADATGGKHPQAARLATGLGRGAGSTIGPDGALYVTEPLVGKVSRIDRRTGRVTTFADGLPTLLPAIGGGGAMDVIFRRGIAYVAVALVASDVGGTSTVGIYRVDGPHKVSVFADLGAFNIANPPETDYFVPTGTCPRTARFSPSASGTRIRDRLPPVGGCSSMSNSTSTVRSTPCPRECGRSVAPRAHPRLPAPGNCSAWTVAPSRSWQRG